MIDTITLLKQLIACPSVTPEDAGAQEVLADALTAMGFECHHLPFSDETGEIVNLFARLGTGSPHICFAGHTDVVPVGDEAAWTSPPFEPTIRDGFIYGRGASDMKGGVAAFVAAVSAYLKDHKPSGSISLLITGDEEDLAVNGTVKVLDWMAKNGHTPDVAIVGEPTNPDELGQEIKIGRRGSLNGYLSVKGVQGHVAYQHLADNPLPRLVKLADALASYRFDAGNEFFPPTNLEISSIDVGNKATNVIPAHGTLAFNIRFNDTWSSETLKVKLREILDSVGAPYEIEFEGNAESFITKPGAWSEIVRDAVADITGRTPDYTTNGGTSDARFVVQHCPVIECGAVNESIHQVDENAKVSDLENLTRIYERILVRYFEG
ncbi:MAG: succinyl-diaminopimelate desuccinylase [Alphaproteobacteria bacterium]|nr:succinyl-diaminopimelate desuccinylase [Alphaproteobacteria bacterium]